MIDKLRNPSQSTGATDGAVPAHGTIELHIREVAQLFDSFDPCPFYSRDLDADAEEYIVASARELHHPPVALVIHIDQRGGESDEEPMLEAAIHQHFTRRVRLESRELRGLLRRGWISLAIGLTFLVALLAISELVSVRLSPGAFSSIIRESLVIGGWVAMWRPLEIFLYDWWPVAGRRRTYVLLSRVPIRIQRVKDIQS